MLAYYHRPVLAPAAVAAASSRQCSLIVSPALSRSTRSLYLKSRSRDAESAPEATDEELLRQLNSAHLWLPSEESDDFGLEDVAAHVANRNQARRLDLAAASRAGKGKRKSGDKRQQQPAPSTLGDIDPASGKLPGWVTELQGAGFDVLGRNGELFLQRGAVTQQPSDSGSSSSSIGARANSQAREPQQAAGGSQPREQQQQTVGASDSAVSDRSLAVRAEFDPLLWQPQTSNSSSSSSSSSSAGSTAGDSSWYTQSAGSSNSSTAGDDAAAGRFGNSSSSSGRLGQTASAAGRAQACRDVQRRLLGFKQPQQLLDYVEGCFPDWAANGCWLLHQQRAGVVVAPTPAEAAAALKGVALAAKRAGFSALQTQGLARDRRVLGLAECLRLAAPRSPPHQDPAITQRLWSIAKAYWLQAGAAATAAQQQLLAAARVAAADAGASPYNGSSSSSSAALNGSAVPSLGPLLAGLQAAGLQLSREQLAAAQSLISARQEDAVRQQAWVSALWGLASIGGPLFFQAEVDALAQVAALSRWQLSSFELSDVLWALASSRHWCPLLGQLEASLMAAGGPAACSAPELITLLWSFATLSHMPKQLLAELNARGWCVKPSSELPAAQRSSMQQHRAYKAAKQQQPQRGDAASHSSNGSVCRLSELSGSQLSALVWSLACLQQADSALFRQAWVEVCRRGSSLAGDVRQLVRVQQAALAVQLEGSYGVTELYCDQGTRQLLNAAAKAFKQQSGALQSKVHSTYQRSIASTLTKMCVMHVLEDNTTGYAVDITVPGLRLAIEADGPSHMSRTRAGKAGRVMLGATAMKRRHLQGLGWAVLNVAYSDWDALQGEAQRTAFLKQQVAAVIAAGSKYRETQQ